MWASTAVVVAFVSRLVQVFLPCALNLSFLPFPLQTWGGEQNGFGLAKCCQDVSLDQFPDTATSVYFELQPSEHSVRVRHALVAMETSRCYGNLFELNLN